MMNVCIVGCGAIGPVHALALEKTESAKLYAVCDLNKERADALANKHGVKVFYDFDEMLHDDNIDSVHICTPHYLHVPMAKKALENGKYVILEKPAAINFDELNELAEYDKKYPHKLGFVLQNRRNERVRVLKDCIEKDEDKGLRLADAFLDQRCADVCDLVGTFVKSEGVLYNESTSIRNIFYEERALFITDRTFIVAGKDTTETNKIEFSYGVVPQPKYDTDQETFLTNVGHPFTMYAVNSKTKDIEAAVTTLEAMGSANHRTVTPAVFEVAMKVRYNDDPQASRMYDILRENISFDAGRLYCDMLGKSTANVFTNTALSGNPSGILSNTDKNKRVIEAGIKDIMKFYAD